jgi:hypothetical protein
MLYKLALFLHVAGALLLCSAIVIEWLCVINIRKMKNIENVKEWVSNYLKLTILGPAVIGLILISGIYMMIVVWHDTAWIIFGFIGIILIAVIGGSIIGRKMRIINKMIPNENNISGRLEPLLTDKAFLFSIKIRTAIFIGIIFLMTYKPELAGSIITLITSIVLGFVPLGKDSSLKIRNKQKVKEN